MGWRRILLLFGSGLVGVGWMLLLFRWRLQICRRIACACDTSCNLRRALRARYPSDRFFLDLGGRSLGRRLVVPIFLLHLVVGRRSLGLHLPLVRLL